MIVHLKYVLLLSIVFSSWVLAEDKVVMNEMELRESHFMFAKKANGETWRLLQKETLSEEEKDLMLYSVYASAYHWSNVGTRVHMQRAEWIISRVYVKLKDGELALYHAKKCLSLTNKENVELKDFDSAYAYEAMARAYALVSDFGNASKYYLKAKSASDAIEKPEDRKLFLSDLKDGNWNGFLTEK